MQKNATILITGASGMVGSALTRLLKENYANLLTPTHSELDLCEQTAVFEYFATHQPEYVFHLAAIVGGIHANNAYPGKFIYDNTQMHCNVLEAVRRFKIKKLLFPGSACTYPKLAPQPIPEHSFLDGLIEPTNVAYAAAKINGIVMCQAYAKQYGLNAIVPMPTNAYGIGDNFDPNGSHVIPALMRRVHEAHLAGNDEIVLWGSGKPLREFIYVDDLAAAFIFLMREHNAAEIINVGTMQEISIIDLAQTIVGIIGFQGKISIDPSKPDGAPRKCLNSKALHALGWQPRVSLQEGLVRMYAHHFGSRPFPSF